MTDRIKTRWWTICSPDLRAIRFILLSCLKLAITDFIGTDSLISVTLQYRTTADQPAQISSMLKDSQDQTITKSSENIVLCVVKAEIIRIKIKSFCLLCLLHVIKLGGGVNKEDHRFEDNLGFIVRLVSSQQQNGVTCARPSKNN